MGEGMAERSNQEEDPFGDEKIEIGVSPRIENFSARIPELEHVPALVESSTSNRTRSFEWPKQFDVQNLPLDKKIKLASFSYQASNYLSAIQLGFTAGVKSEKVKAGMASSTMYKMEIDPKRQIGAVELQYDRENNIYGISFIDRKREVIVEETWREVP